MFFYWLGSLLPYTRIWICIIVTGCIVWREDRQGLVITANLEDQARGYCLGESESH